MTDEQKFKLDHNLTLSARKAKPGWLRVRLGNTEAEQGFIDPESLDVVVELKKEINKLKDYISELVLKFSTAIDLLTEKVKNLELLEESE